MKKVSSLALVAAALAIGCAAPAFAATAHKGANKDSVRDADSGITLHAPRHDDHAAAGTAEHKFSAEVKAALQRVASATRRAAHRADDALHDLGHKNGDA
jgi:hypothetical protein